MSVSLSPLVSQVGSLLEYEAYYAISTCTVVFNALMALVVHKCLCHLNSKLCYRKIGLIF